MPMWRAAGTQLGRYIVGRNKHLYKRIYVYYYGCARTYIYIYYTGIYSVIQHDWRVIRSRLFKGSYIYVRLVAPRCESKIILDTINDRCSAQPYYINVRYTHLCFVLACVCVCKVYNRVYVYNIYRISRISE